MDLPIEEKLKTEMKAKALWALWQVALLPSQSDIYKDRLQQDQPPACLESQKF